MKKGLIILAAALMLVCVVSCAASKDNGTLVIDFNTAKYPTATDTSLPLASVTNVYLQFNNGKKDYNIESMLDVTKAFESKKQVAKVSLPAGTYGASVYFVGATSTDYCYFDVCYGTDTNLVIEAGKELKAVVSYEEN